MLVAFSVKNFFSIKDRQTLSFEADKSDKLESDFIISGPRGERLLKVAILYGQNASGKTNILLALDFLRDLVLEPKEKKTSTFKFEPFKFDHESMTFPTEMELIFYANETKYSYNISFDKECILSESLSAENDRKYNVYKRLTDKEKHIAEISFNRSVKVGKSFKESLEANTLWNNTVLGGYLKTNIEISDLKDVSNWFKNHLKPIVQPNTHLFNYVTEKIESNEIDKSLLIRILQKADFNISDIIVERGEEEIPNEIFEFLKQQLSKDDSSIENVGDDRKVKTIDVKLVHDVNGKYFDLPFKLESLGTTRFYGLAGLLALAIKGEIVIPIDELESSLHPDLYEFIYLAFLKNSKKSQLLFTTHNRELLSDRNLFRDDSVWFVNKNEESSTELYSLIDFDSGTIRNSTNIMNAYKSGKLKAVPNIGDYYL